MRRLVRILVLILMVLAVSAVAGCKVNTGIGSVNDRGDLGSGEGVDPRDVSILNGMDPVELFQNGWDLPCPDMDGDGIPNEEDVDLTLGDDCNGNGVDDLYDVDADGNGFVDECETCEDDEYYDFMKKIIIEEFEDNVSVGDVSTFVDIGYEDAANCKPIFSSVQDQLDTMYSLREQAVENNDCWVEIELTLFINFVEDSYSKGFLIGESECNDDDGDGVPNDCDVDQTEGEDCDENGILDECEADTDEDGIIDACDENDDRVCPYGELECDDDDHGHCRNEDGKKVWILHNGRAIHVSQNALQAHLDHGDKLLECED